MGIRGKCQDLIGEKLRVNDFKGPMSHVLRHYRTPSPTEAGVGAVKSQKRKSWSR